MYSCLYDSKNMDKLTIVTYFLCAFGRIAGAHSVATFADNRFLFSRNGDVVLPEPSLRNSATVIGTNGQHPVIMDGAVHHYVAEFARLVGEHWCHADDRSRNSIWTENERFL